MLSDKGEILAKGEKKKGIIILGIILEIYLLIMEVVCLVGYFEYSGKNFWGSYDNI